MGNALLRWWGCGAFDVCFGDVNIAFDPYLFGENLENAEPIFDYIFISHEHFDHCHPPTLLRLCRGDRFKKLFVSHGCIHPDRPISEKYGDAAFDRDLPITKHISEDKVQIIYPKHRSVVREEGRIFSDPVEVDLGPISVETIESGENARLDIPTCGYLVTHKEKEISFLHTGDLHQAYPALQNVQGRVDFAIHMKLGLAEWGSDDISPRLLKFVELVKPRFLIPIHYRTDRVSDPIPSGHWPPNVTDVAALIESIREIVGDKTTVLPLTAGVEYELELREKKILWKWKWYDSWTAPPWRE